MRKLPFNSLIFCAMAAAAVMLTACSSSSNNDEASNYRLLMDSDSIPKSVKNIVKAVNENDPAMFAKEVSYPLQRPYPLKDIADEEEMKSYYSVLVDDSLRNVILNSMPGDWQEFGWRGYSLHDGEYLWLDGKIYAVNYTSQRELNLIDSLTNVEKRSLPLKLESGWQPVMTLKSENNSESESKIFRIDGRITAKSNSGDEYRLSIYDWHDNPAALREMPQQILYGGLRVEGSAAIVSYIFKDSDGKEYVFYPEDPGTGTPTLETPDGNETELSKAYWYELIR